MRDERLMLHEQQAEVKRREEAVAAREVRVTEQEKLIVAAAPTAEPVAPAPARSAMTRFTSAPFQMARSVFGGKK